MSNHWDLHCRNCNASAGFDRNGGAELLASLWKVRHSIAGLLPVAVPQLDGSLGDPDWSFFATHSDHDVCPRDEYGRDLVPAREPFPVCAHGMRSEFECLHCLRVSYGRAVGDRLRANAELEAAHRAAVASAQNAAAARANAESAQHRRDDRHKAAQREEITRLLAEVKRLRALLPAGVAPPTK